MTKDDEGWQGMMSLQRSFKDLTIGRGKVDKRLLMKLTKGDMVASIGGGIEWIPPIDLFILNIFLGSGQVIGARRGKHQ
jgi:hypothetical protein